ncbi:YbjP/YqhG family protein [Sphingomonas japonica]|uniref:Uncharacterized protein n=1 Tax=Sphingomonas japonica TaxID=511662 RepID=A0ABX0TW93_9SPHN|nr:YbjP/YqhG family protein [Sphingomonas japonica]NIJ22591.1 hypothetical protein [Sphingomonas japonica]
MPTDSLRARVMRCFTTLGVAVIAALTVPTASAQWQTIEQPGGYAVARIEMAGPIRGVGITCERGVPILAVRPERSPARSPADLELVAGDGRSVRVALARNGRTDVWVAAIRNPQILDAIAASPVNMALTGARAQLSSDGASQAFRQALAGCYRPGPGSVAAAPAAATGQRTGVLSAADIAAIQRAVRANYDGSGVAAANHLTPAYRAVSERCAQLQEAIDGKFGEADSFGMCGEDASPICQCQDIDDEAVLASLKIAAEPAEPGAAIATARFDLFRSQTAEARSPRTILYRVVRTGSGWQIDDILARDGGGARSVDRALLLTGIREMEGRLGIKPGDAAATPPPPAVAGGPLSPADTAAAFRAAGFVQRGADWRSDCDDPGTASYSPGSVETVRDLNGDGFPEAILIESGTYCYGNTGQGYFIVSKGANGAWRPITSGTGIVTVLSSRGTSNWLDLEIGGPGFCFPVYRWNGREYAEFRRQYDGKPCAN